MLDTNVVSETRKRKADDGVLSFLAATPASALYISVLTLGELRKGVTARKLSDAETGGALEKWVNGLQFSYADRIIGIDLATATLWGELSALRSRPVIDTLLAATAIVHDMRLVTRNVRDVRGIPVNVLNPWTASRF